MKNEKLKPYPCFFCGDKLYGSKIPCIFCSDNSCSLCDNGKINIAYCKNKDCRNYKDDLEDE